MKEVTKEELEQWCSNYGNCYYYLLDGEIYNTGPCPFMCEEIAIDISQSPIFEEVTDDAEKYHPQLAYEVDRNDCRLFRIKSRYNSDIIISYFGHRLEDEDEA